LTRPFDHPALTGRIDIRFANEGVGNLAIQTGAETDTRVWRRKEASANGAQRQSGTPMELETRMIIDMATSIDGKKGIRALAER
jgi:hypothetical protein